MNRLKELRKAHNLKSKELAETIGVSYQTTAQMGKWR